MFFYRTLVVRKWKRYVNLKISTLIKLVCSDYVTFVILSIIDLHILFHIEILMLKVCFFCYHKGTTGTIENIL